MIASKQDPGPPNSRSMPDTAGGGTAGSAEVRPRNPGNREHVHRTRTAIPRQVHTTRRDPAVHRGVGSLSAPRSENGREPGTDVGRSGRDLGLTAVALRHPDNERVITASGFDPTRHSASSRRTEKHHEIRVGVAARSSRRISARLGGLRPEDPPGDNIVQGNPATVVRPKSRARYSAGDTAFQAHSSPAFRGGLPS